MAFTKTHARLLAGIMPNDDREALRSICGKGDKQFEVSPQCLDYLEAMDLVKRSQSVEERPRELVLLTSKGHKVAAFI